MATDTNLNQLVINKLTKAQYQAAKEAGQIVETELYMTTDEEEITPESIGAATADHTHSNVYTKTEVDSLVSANGYSVGDIKTTARTDLGDDWLLCNGSDISASDYPELCELSTLPYARSSSAYGNDIAYYDGRWVMTSGSGFIYTTTDPTGGIWTKVTLTNCTQASCVVCYNGRWVVGAADSSTYPCIYTTTSPTGTWTKVTLNSSNQEMVIDIAVYNGTYVAVSKDNGSYGGAIYTTTSPTGTWTSPLSLSTYGNLFKCVACYNGRWVVIMTDIRGNNTNKYTYTYTTTSPTGTWNQYKWSTTYEISSLICNAGTWVAIGEKWSSGTATSGNYVLTTSTPTSTTWSATSITTSGNETNQIVYDNGTYIVAGGEYGSYPCLYMSTDLTTWTKILIGRSFDTQVAFDSVGYFEGIWVASTTHSSNSGVVCSTRKALPIITYDEAYGRPFAYIKAK